MQSVSTATLVKHVKFVNLSKWEGNFIQYNNRHEQKRIHGGNVVSDRNVK